MTKRDYITIAGECHRIMQELYDSNKNAELEGAYRITSRLANRFASENSKFNRDKFWNAVGFSEWGVK